MPSRAPGGRGGAHPLPKTAGLGTQQRPQVRVCIICNPPYGERLGEKKEAEQIYREMGKVFKRLDTWSFYILTACERFEKLFGRRAGKKHKLYNGRIKVDLYQYFAPRKRGQATF